MKKNTESFTRQFKSWFDRNPLKVLIVLIVFFISSFFTIGEGASWLKNYYRNTFKWKELEYERINKLSAGINVEIFYEILGSPLFVKESRKKLKENAFKGRGYWVQAISNTSGEVLLYSITTCDEDFVPEILNNPLQKKIVLGESTFKSFNLEPLRLRYFLSGATANSYFFDEYYLGNPSYYKTVFLGINDACSFDNHYLGRLATLENKYRIKNKIVDKFRTETKINTYSETAPHVDIDEILEEFQLGVDRIQIRTLR